MCKMEKCINAEVDKCRSEEVYKINGRGGRARKQKREGEKGRRRER
jgi:hypothetical protein